MGTGPGHGDGVRLEVSMIYWNWLEIWRETGLGLGMKARTRMRLECSGKGVGCHNRHQLWFLQEESQSHACQDADDDTGEVQHDWVRAGEENGVYDDEAEAEAGNTGQKHEGPGKVQQI